MHIARGETQDFDDYAVRVVQDRGRWLRYGPTRKPIETRYPHAVEADDDTGLLVEHLHDDNGNPVYTNGLRDIVIDNTAVLLMLLPLMRQEFKDAGFVPKLTTKYFEGELQILRRDGRAVGNVTKLTTI